MLFILQMSGAVNSLDGMHDSDTKKGQDIKASLGRSPLYSEYCWRCPRADHLPLRPSHGHVFPSKKENILEMPPSIRWSAKRWLCGLGSSI